MSFLYRSRIAQYNHQLKKYKNAARNIGWSRVLMFALIVAGVVLYWGQPITLSIILAGGGLLFFRLVFLNAKANTEVTYLNAIIEINRKEVKANEGKYEQFENGTEFIDFEHPYAHDFDLFGPHSLFPFINRTVSFFGRQKLAEWMQKPFTEVAAIRERQEAVKELKGKLDWRQDFLATGLIHRLDGMDAKRVRIWYKRKKGIGKGIAFKVILWTLPVISFALLLLVIFGLLKWTLFFMYLFVPLAFVGAYLKQINRQYFLISNIVTKISVLNKLLGKIETETFDTALLKGWQAELIVDGKTASERIAELKRLLDMFEQRQNMLIGVVLNAFLLWDLHLVRRMNSWKIENALELEHWLSVVARFDAMISLGNYAYNNSKMNYPEISEEAFHFETTEVGHPMIPEKERVINDFALNGKGRIDIITGANMAGKSTFLRTIGVNLLLGMIGAPVAARTMKFSPMKLFSSMRTEDSLSSHTSYFYAELKRLQRLMDLVRSGESVFVILDEILKGTNSVDKAKGSRAFAEGLIKYNVMGMLATHDLSLCELENTHPENIKNYRFDVIFEGDDLRYDYKLEKGICEHMNASFLLKKMGIVDNI